MLDRDKHVERRAAPGHSSFATELHPVLARVYANRHIQSDAELDYALAGLPATDKLLGVDAAVELLVQALAEQWPVLVVGDFDADGATSTALAVQALGLMGLHHVDFLVPNRFDYGYGLTPEIVAVAAARNPRLIVTVDNGISSIDGVASAQARGIKVLVTDHHLPGATLPQADAIVNPNQPGDAFPSKNLAGVGVIFYLMLALRSRLRGDGWFGARGPAEPNLAQLLDLVALGTVADVVSLDQVNRTLVAQGMARIRSGHCRPGIRALCEVSGRDQERLVAADLGYALGPRLNAAGRLDDMSLGIRCLLAHNEKQALPIAAQLDKLNRQRRGIEGEMQEQALAELRRVHLDDDSELPMGLCLYNPTWHEGVIGILASRIKERVHRPVIVFTDSGEGQVKGSARSIPGLHIRDTLDAVAAHHPGLLSRFGGHAMAAGMTLEREHLDEFRQAFDREIRRQIQPADLEPVVLSDGPLNSADLSLELAETLRSAGPWGQGFPEPLFDGEFRIVQQRVVGERHLKLVLGVDDGSLVDGIAFNFPVEAWNMDAQRALVVYRLDVNEYRGERNVQLIIDYMRELN